MAPDEIAAARVYDRWMTSHGPHAALMRFLMTVPGMILVNTPALRLPEEVRIRRHERLLDIGCGRASLLRLLASRVRFTSRPVGLARGLATALPFADDTFHLLLCGHLFKYLSDAELRLCLREIRRVLRPGGIAIVWEMAPTKSRLLNRFNRWVISREKLPLTLRTYRELHRAARDCSFDWIDHARLRPFLVPPIPRVSLILGKAPHGWKPRGRRLRTPQEKHSSEQTCVD
jgi:SAM-dependent methyltransferase